MDVIANKAVRKTLVGLARLILRHFDEEDSARKDRLRQMARERIG
jgi:hypothetical protein